MEMRCVSRYEVVVKALIEMKTIKAFEHSDVSLELIACSKEVGIQGMAELCQR